MVFLFSAKVRPFFDESLENYLLQTVSEASLILMNSCLALQYESAWRVGLCHCRCPKPM